MSDIEEVGQDLGDVLANEFRGVVVDFWSPWCGPCRPLKRQLRKIADQHEQKWRFVAVNTEAHPDVAEAYAVRSLPTVLIFKRSAEIHRFDGGILPSAVDDKLHELGLTQPV